MIALNFHPCSAPRLSGHPSAKGRTAGPSARRMELIPMARRKTEARLMLRTLVPPLAYRLKLGSRVFQELRLALSFGSERMLQGVVVTLGVTKIIQSVYLTSAKLISDNQSVVFCAWVVLKEE